MSEVLKRCSKCKQEKPATTEYFTRKKRMSDGLNGWCKQCGRDNYQKYMITDGDERRRRNRENAQKYRSEDPEKFRKISRDNGRLYRLRHPEKARAVAVVASRKYRAKNPDKVRLSNARWAALHPGAASERAIRWRRQNPERFRQYRRQYWVTNSERIKAKLRADRFINREKYIARESRRRSRKRNAEGKHTAHDIMVQYGRQRGKCYYCGCKMGKKYHVDHVIPLVRGGGNGPENIVIACPHCNMSKGSKLPHEWPKGSRLL